MANKLIGKSVDGWDLTDYLGCGKSAVVLKANHANGLAAVKLFDPELIRRYGDDTQQKRIGRELALINEHHENLVRIYGGGYWKSEQLHYVVMEYIDAPNLAQVVENSHPCNRVWKIISEIASAARFLETLGLAHRDIKPSNVVLERTSGKAILLDLGVLRPIGNSNITDEDQRNFIGTLQYSSPEFLFRNEEDTRDGWRALTFYQLGAVLHDLITGRPLFHEHSDPWAGLVDAVKNTNPKINGGNVPRELVQLARNCLVKNPHTRLDIVTWDSFQEPKEERDPVNAAKRRLQDSSSWDL